MNRRNFLKSLGAACGAVVVAPAVLLKARKKPIKVPWVHYHTEYHYSNDEFVREMKRAFRNTKFKRPVSKGTIGEFVNMGKFYDLRVFSEAGRIAYRRKLKLHETNQV